MQLTASYLTLAGSRFGEPVKNDIILRSAAAHAAGYSSIGASAQEIIASGESLYAIRQAIHQCPVREVEWVDLYQIDRSVWHTVFAMAEILGATRVNAGICRSGEVNLMAATVTLKKFAHAASKHNLAVCVEPVAFSTMWRPSDINNLVNVVQEMNVGILYDTWQFARAEIRDPASVDVPWWRVNSVQIADSGPWSADGLFIDSQDHRVLPGQGSANVGGQISKLLAEGFTGPMSVEVASAELRNIGVYAAARETYNATVKVLGSCGLS